jgi:hypothetical protein
MRYSLFILLFMLHSPAFAGDEDMNPTAYSVFDPVTGFMIPSEGPPPPPHIPNTNATTQAPTDTVTPTPPSTATSQAMTSPNTLEDKSKQSPMWMYLVAVALILGGFAAWVRNKEKINKSNLD